MSQSGPSPTRPWPEQSAAGYERWIEGLGRGETILRRCGSCGLTQWPPRPTCSRCRGEELVDHPVDPVGTVHTFTVVHRAFHPWFSERTPYAVAVVEVEPTIRLTGFFDGDLDRLRCDLPVRGAIEDRGGSPALVWRPSEEVQ